MKSSRIFLMLGIVITLGFLTLTGCCQQCATPGENKTPSKTSDAASTAIPPVLVEYKEAIQKLPESEWAAVYKQVNCPVSGQPLGSMGTPIKVTVQGQDVYICCEGCRKALEDNPEKYLTKFPK